MNLDLHLAFLGPKNATDDDFDGFIDLVIEELEQIGREDIEVSARLAKRDATFTVFTDGDRTPSVDQFLADVRTALHAADCITAGWERGAQELRTENLALV